MMELYGCPTHLQEETGINDEGLFTLPTACLKCLRMPWKYYSKMIQTVSSEYVQDKVINNYNYYVPISKICHKNIWHK